MATEHTGAAQQAVLAQRQLEKHYTTVYKALVGYRHSIEVCQHVLVWKRPGLAVALYAFVHWLFILQVRSNDGPVSQLGNLLFWLVIADIMYRAATNQGQDATGDSSGTSEGSRTDRGWSLRGRGQAQSPSMMSFEDAVMKRYTPRESGVVPSFEVVCLWLADAWMFLDNALLVLKHWSINEPLMFSVILGVPGLFLVLLGRCIPTLILLYVLVMFLLTWPYVEHHNLRVKLVALAQAHYPGVLEKVKALYNFMKTLALSRSKEDIAEFSLNEGEDEARTEQALQEAFDQATGQQNQQQREPGLSLLQDSAQGLHPNAFQHSDLDSLVVGSLAPGPGDFPSISNLDQSLTLPAFPQVHDPQGVLPSIGEQDEDTSLALSSHGSNTDLDPLLDSLDLEFGYDFTDNGQRSNVTGQTRRHTPTQPSPLVTATTRAESGSRATGGYQAAGSGYEHGYAPPPTYQSAVDGTDGGITTAGGRDGYEWPIVDPPWPLGGSSGGNGPKSSSTPLIREGMRQRGSRQRSGNSGSRQQSDQARHSSEENALFAQDSALLQELDTL